MITKQLARLIDYQEKNTAQGLLQQSEQAAEREYTDFLQEIYELSEAPLLSAAEKEAQRAAEAAAQAEAASKRSAATKVNLA